jgi:predicted dehydrogenase
MARSSTASTRRDFLGKGARVGAALLAAPFVGSRWGYGREGGVPPGERVRLAHVGLGGRGSSLLSQSLGTAGVAVAGVCDVFAPHRERAKAAAGAVEAVGDYRAFLDRKDIDAVVIATPDHWHALITIDAAAAGKDVYVEKPLSTFVAEGRAMVESARRHGRMVQVGTHHRSEAYVREVAEIVRSGRIGAVRKVKCWMWENPVKEPSAGSEPPEGLDWERWLGPAPLVPYHPERVHFNFRWCRDYAGGYMTDWGVHMLDVVAYAMEIDHKGPESVEATGVFAPRNLYDFPIAMEARWEFRDPDFTLEWIQPSAGGEVAPGERYGMTFYGEAGQLRTWFGGHKLFAGGKEVPLPAGGRGVELPRSPGHFRNWLDSIKSRKLPLADVEVGHRTASICQLGNIALFSGRKLRWDWRRERFEDDAEADRLLSREPRAPYVPRVASS